MSNFGWQGKLMSLAFGGNTFIAVKMWYPLHEKIGSEIFHARKNLYRIYDSYATFDAEAPAQETAPELPEEQDPAHEADTQAPMKSRRLISVKGKWLRPGGRDEKGWKGSAAS
jgi:hypothetical protein